MTRVLVVDDEPGLRQSLGLLLSDAGYEVAAEGDGSRALERALAETFDLALCDVLDWREVAYWIGWNSVTAVWTGGSACRPLPAPVSLGGHVEA